MSIHRNRHHSLENLHGTAFAGIANGAVQSTACIDLHDGDTAELPHGNKISGTGRAAYTFDRQGSCEVQLFGAFKVQIADKAPPADSRPDALATVYQLMLMALVTEIRSKMPSPKLPGLIAAVAALVDEQRAVALLAPSLGYVVGNLSTDWDAAALDSCDDYKAQLHALHTAFCAQLDANVAQHFRGLI